MEIGVPFGTTDGSHAETLIGTRMQPCDAGYPGTCPPWTANPPVKYSGLWSRPRWDVRQPLIRL